MTTNENDYIVEEVIGKYFDKEKGDLIECRFAPNFEIRRNLLGSGNNSEIRELVDKFEVAVEPVQSVKKYEFTLGKGTCVAIHYEVVGMVVGVVAETSTATINIRFTDENEDLRFTTRTLRDSDLVIYGKSLTRSRDFGWDADDEDKGAFMLEISIGDFIGTQDKDGLFNKRQVIGFSKTAFLLEPFDFDVDDPNSRYLLDTLSFESLALPFCLYEKIK
jgi:hypothetical protein